MNDELLITQKYDVPIHKGLVQYYKNYGYYTNHKYCSNYYKKQKCDKKLFENNYLAIYNNWKPYIDDKVYTANQVLRYF